jgi:hypothetical protein
VIVEFCLYGNLQKFILANRPHFINQINPVTGHMLVQQALYLFVKHINPFMPDTIRTHTFFIHLIFCNSTFFSFLRQQTSFHQPNQPSNRSHACATGTLLVCEAHQPTYAGHNQNAHFFYQSYFLQLNLFFFSSPTYLISSTKSTQKQVTFLCNRHFICLLTTSTHLCRTRSELALFFINLSFCNSTFFFFFNLVFFVSQINLVYRSDETCPLFLIKLVL